MLKKTKTIQTGFTLTEITVGLFIGAIILASTLYVFSSLSRSGSQSLSRSRLNQDLSALINVISDDVRRAGYWNWTPELSIPLKNNPFVQQKWDIEINRYDANETHSSCITFSYDLDGDSLPGEKRMEQFGYRLRNKTIEMRTGGSSFNCQSGNWQRITQTGMEINELSFLLNSYRINTSKSDPETPCQANDLCVLRRSLHISIIANNSGQQKNILKLNNLIQIKNDKIF